MRELNSEELELVAGGAYPGPFLRAWAATLPEFPNSLPGTIQRAADNIEDFLEGPKAFVIGVPSDKVLGNASTGF